MQNFLTEKEVALQINVSLPFAGGGLQQGPRFTKVGALVRYRPEDLEHWMDAIPAGLLRRERFSLSTLPL